MQAHNAYSLSALGDSGTLIELANGKRMILRCSPRQYSHGLKKYKEGAFIQDAFDFLDADEREFLLSGLYPEELERLMGVGNVGR